VHFEFTRQGEIDPLTIRRCPACENGLEDSGEFTPGLLICAGCRSVIERLKMQVVMTGASLLRFVELFRFFRFFIFLAFEPRAAP